MWCKSGEGTEELVGASSVDAAARRRTGQKVVEKQNAAARSNDRVPRRKRALRESGDCANEGVVALPSTRVVAPTPVALWTKSRLPKLAPTMTFQFVSNPEMEPWKL
jgi:hypothetical protein